MEGPLVVTVGHLHVQLQLLQQPGQEVEVAVAGGKVQQRVPRAATALPGGVPTSQGVLQQLQLSSLGQLEEARLFCHLWGTWKKQGKAGLGMGGAGVEPPTHIPAPR